MPLCAISVCVLPLIYPFDKHKWHYEDAIERSGGRTGGCACVVVIVVVILTRSTHCSSMSCRLIIGYATRPRNRCGGGSVAVWPRLQLCQFRDSIQLCRFIRTPRRSRAHARTLQFSHRIEQDGSFGQSKIVFICAGEDGQWRQDMKQDQITSIKSGRPL